MKKLLSLILFLAVLSPPALLFGAAAAVTSREQLSRGNFVGVIGLVTVNSGDTITTGLRDVIYFSMLENPTTGPGAASVASWTATGGVVTVYVETDGRRYRFEAVGTP